MSPGIIYGEQLPSLFLRSFYLTSFSKSDTVPKYTRNGGRIWWIFPEQQIIENSRNFNINLTFGHLPQKGWLQTLGSWLIKIFFLSSSLLPHTQFLFSPFFNSSSSFPPLLPTELLSQTLSLENFPWLAFSFVLKIQTPHTFLDANEVQGKKRYVPVNL